MPLILKILLGLFAGNMLLNVEKGPELPAWFERMDYYQRAEFIENHDFKYHLRYGLEAHCAQDLEQK